MRVNDVDVVELETLKRRGHTLDDVLAREAARVRRLAARAEVELECERRSRSPVLRTLVAMVISSRFQPSSLMMRPSSSSDWPFEYTSAVSMSASER